MQIRSVHRALGLALCLVIIVISVTGVLLVWKREYLVATVPHAGMALQTDVEQIANTVDRIIADQPTGNVRLIQIHHEQTSLYKALLQDSEAAWYDQSGQKIQQWSSNDRLEDWLLDLHHRFLLGNTIGLNIAGFAGILLVPLAFFGVAVWWRRRRTLRFGVWPKSCQRSHLMISHGNTGALSLVPILLIAITGVILVYPVESSKILLPSELGDSHKTPIETQIDFASTVSKLSYARQVFPAATIRWVRPATIDYPETIIGVQQTIGLNRLGNTQLSFEGGGKLLITDAVKQISSKRLFDFMLPLHTGKLPLWYRLLLTLFGVALTTISVFGLRSYYLSVKQNSIQMKEK